LLLSIFHKNGALHDGAVIIREDRVVAAACMLPLSENNDLDRDLGTRHRAAIGVTEGTDAIAIVVSEETGRMAVAHNGRLARRLDEGELDRLLFRLCQPRSETARGEK
jgi:diadenylate cyclase